MHGEWSVFIGSPGDLEEERKAIKRAAELVSATVGENVGRRIRILVSDHVQPDFGRPQSLINPLVDTCDVFLGLVNRRWGSPTGVDSSGFFEEYSRALERRQDSTSPKIAIFFRKIDPSDIEDAGPQLTKVLKFRSEIEHEHTVYFREFDDARGLEAQISIYFSGLLTSGLAANRGTSEGFTSTVDRAEEDEGIATTDDARAEVAKMFEDFSAFAQGRDNDIETDEDRLLLIAAGLTRDAPLIPVHVINRLYLREHPLTLARAEHFAWLRAFLADFGKAQGRSDRLVVAGWKYLYPSGSEVDFWEGVASEIWSGDAAVESGALRLLTAYTRQPKFLWPAKTEGSNKSSIADYVDRWLRLLASSSNLDNLLQYIFQVYTDTDIPLLRAVSELVSEETAKVSLQSILDARKSQFSSLVQLLPKRKFQTPIRWVTDHLEAHLSELDSSTLRVILRHDPAIEELLAPVIGELLKRGEMKTGDFETALTAGNEGPIKAVLATIDTSADFDTRVMLGNAVKAIGKKGIPHGMMPHVLSAIFPSDDLLPMLEGHLTGVDAWLALSLRPPAGMTEQAKAVYDSNGEALGGAIPVLEDGEFLDLLETLRASARLGAIRIIARDTTATGRSDALTLLEKELDINNWYTREEVVLEILRLVSAEESELLVRLLASPSINLLNREITEGVAEKVSPTYFEALLTSEEEVQVRTGLMAVMRTKHASFPTTLVVKALRHDDSATRLLAVEALASTHNGAELSKFLDEYIAQSPYYYNVLTAFDRLLFAPTR